MLLNQKKLKKKRIIYFFLQKKNINFFFFNLNCRIHKIKKFKKKKHLIPFLTNLLQTTLNK